MINKTVKYWTSEEIVNLVKAFENCTLPRDEWTHQAHLIVALWYLTHYSQSKATNCIKNRIQNYNNAIALAKRGALSAQRCCKQIGIKTTKDSGYHETITLFWIKIVWQYLIVEGKNLSLVDLVNDLSHHYSNPRLPLEYYSCDRLMSWQARRSWEATTYNRVSAYKATVAAEVANVN